MCAIGVNGRPLLASVGSDATVRLWDPATRRQTGVVQVPSWAMAATAIGSGRLAIALATGVLVIAIGDENRKPLGRTTV